MRGIRDEERQHDQREGSNAVEKRVPTIPTPTRGPARMDANQERCDAHEKKAQVPTDPMQNPTHICARVPMDELWENPDRDEANASQHDQDRARFDPGALKRSVHGSCKSQRENDQKKTQYHQSSR
ncbi:MAG TPA: hypothetical protein VGN34_15825, partial [Ktedonobacteraceae bacterium]